MFFLILKDEEIQLATFENSKSDEIYLSYIEFKFWWM